jgi:hypothetical protein
MREITGLTLSEISKELNIPVNTLRQRLTRLGIKPITKEAIYAPDVLNILNSVSSPGRPKKAAGKEAVKPKAGKPKTAKPKLTKTKK